MEQLGKLVCKPLLGRRSPLGQPRNSIGSSGRAAGCSGQGSGAGLRVMRIKVQGLRPHLLAVNWKV